MKHWPKTLVLAALLGGCGEEDPISYSLFNCEEDSTFVHVGEAEILSGDDCDGGDLLQLRSSSCEVSVGQASISPCGGPIDTEHEIVVKVNSTYSHEIAKVTAVLESGQRGEDEYTLTPDSADEGLYKVTLISVGSEGEQRDDLLRIKLWKEDPEASDE
ncbi:MAG: hypothetical protein VX944_06630 [Myxococcota bacterium]|nr:hypothetical protein [Myxococcota bacterium]MEC9389733.1 hypothetical protein [Myxococcota bacterium]